MTVNEIKKKLIEQIIGMQRLKKLPVSILRMRLV